MAAGFCARQTLTQFSLLHTAFIDTSSILYMEKCGCLTRLSRAITLRIVPGVSLEYGPGHLPCTIYHPVSLESSTDMALYAACMETGLPLVSEDKKLLKRVAGTGLPCFNSLLMFIFLLYKQAIPYTEFNRYYNTLQQIARYSKGIWDYGAVLVREIMDKHREARPFP